MNTVEMQKILKSLSHEAYLFVFSIAICVYAALSFCAFYADGAHWFFMMLQSQGFSEFIEPSRRSVFFLQQFPTFIALKFGIKNIWFLSFIYNLTLELLPLLLTIASVLFLPKDKKYYLIFPFIFYFFGVQSSGFAPIGEAATAAAYFWVLFYFILFSELSVRRAIFFFLVSLPVIWLHQVWSFLGVLMIFILLWRIKSIKNIILRLLLNCMVLWYFLIVCLQASWIIAPRDAGNRDGFFSSFVSLDWLAYPGGVNLPAAFGLFLIFIILIRTVLSRSFACCKRRWFDQFLLIFTLATVIASLWATIAGINIFMPSTNFHARNHGALLSGPLALLCFLFAAGIISESYLKQSTLKYLLIILASGVLIWQIIGVSFWRSYVTNFQAMLNSGSGYIALEDAMQPLSIVQKKNINTFTWPWTNPTMSYLLSKDGVVTTIISNQNILAWQPFDPANLSSLPHNSYFDTSPYINAVSVKLGTTFYNLTTNSLPIGMMSVEGMSYGEGWARWSNSRLILFKFNSALPSSFNLYLDVSSVYGPNIGKPFVVHVGERKASFEIDINKPTIVRIHFDKVNNANTIGLTIPEPISPRKFMGAEDDRILGIALKGIKIEDAKKK